MDTMIQVDAGFVGWTVFHLLFLGLALHPLIVLREYIKSNGAVAIHSKPIPPDANVRRMRDRNEAYVLFLSGVGRVSSLTYSKREQGILQRIADLCPTAVVLDDVFAYSINNLPLTENRRLSAVWRWAMRRKLKKTPLNAILGYLINFRNIVQIVTSADRRYASLYNQAFARVLVNHLRHYGFDLKDPKPILIVSYSGAGQIAAGAVQHLSRDFGLTVHALMLACFFTEGPGVSHAHHIWEFIGRRDRAYGFCYFFTPSRWTRFASTPWTRFVEMGKTTRVDMGAMKHTGRGGYLDQNSHLPNGLSYIDHTASQLAGIINRVCAQPALKG